MKKWFVIFSVAMMVTVFARVPAYPEAAQEETQKGSASPLLMAQAAEEASRPEESGGFEERLLEMGTEGGVEGANPIKELMRYEQGQIKYQILQFIPPLLQSALVGDAFILPPGAFRVTPSNRFVKVDGGDFFKDGSRLPGFEKFKVTRNFIDLGLFYGFDLNRKYLHSFTTFLNIPYISSRADGFINPNGVRLFDIANEGSSLKLGDISLIVKKKLLDQANSPVQLAAAGGFFFPTGKNDEKFGDNGRVSIRAPRIPLLGLTAPPVGVPIPTRFLENLGRGTGAFPFNDGIFNRFSDDGPCPPPSSRARGRSAIFWEPFSPASLSRETSPCWEAGRGGRLFMRGLSTALTAKMMASMPAISAPPLPPLSSPFTKTTSLPWPGPRPPFWPSL